MAYETLWVYIVSSSKEQCVAGMQGNARLGSILDCTAGNLVSRKVASSSSNISSSTVTVIQVASRNGFTRMIARRPQM